VTIEHFIVFIGASAALSTELNTLSKRIEKAHIIAPAVKKKQIGATEAAIRIAAQKLFDTLSNEQMPSEPARLSVWMYEPSSFSQFESVLDLFGQAAWFETIPRSLEHKVRPTKEYIESRVKDLKPLMHQISGATFAQRKSSPLSLPLRNFSSQITTELKRYWYNDLSEEQLSRRIKGFKSRYAQLKDRERQGFQDDRSLIFSPARDTECHGMPHPVGAEPKPFTCGRFRFGVALYPGFHFDVSASKSATIQCDLSTHTGGRREVRGEKRTYINIFPNDFLLPERPKR